MSHPPLPEPSDPNASRPDGLPADGENAPVLPNRDRLLRRTVIRPVIRPDPVDAAYVATRLTALTHDLANLLDGSLRVINLARRSVDADTQHGSVSPAAEGACHLSPELLGKQLETLHAAMQQMASLVRESMVAMNRGGLSLSNIRAPFGSGGPLSEGIIHAVEVMWPLADERNITLIHDVSPELHAMNCGPMYTVVANGIRNAIEAVQIAAGQSPAAPGQPDGNVHIKAWTEPIVSAPGMNVVIEITDDGIGPPNFPPAAAGSDPVIFHHGFTTKAGNTGLGLAISLDVVRQLGGTINLSRRPVNIGTGRGGAVLRVTYPTAGVTNDTLAKTG